MTSTQSNPAQPPNDADLACAESAGGSEFVLSGCLTVDDALAAHRLANRGYRPWVALAVVIIVTFTIVVIAVAVSSRPYSPHAANVMLLVACVIFPALLLVPIAIGRFRLHQVARSRLGMFAPTHTTISSSKILLTTENLKSELQWGLFSHCIANETVAILYLKNSNQSLILARQKLKDSSRWSEFLAIIQSQLGGRLDTV